MLLRLLVTMLHRLARRHGETPVQPDRIRSLVVIEVTRLGDFLVVLPTLPALRRHFPVARIAIVADERYAPFARTVDPDIDIVSLDPRGSSRLFLRAIGELRSRTPDIALSMSPGRRNAILALTSGARWNVGYLTPRDSLTPYLLDAIPVEATGLRLPSPQAYGGENIEDRAWKVLRALGIPEKRAWVQRGSERNERSRKNSVAIHPFSGWEYRSWDLDAFVNLARRIVTTTGLDVVFIVPKAQKNQVAVLRSCVAGISGVRIAEVGTLDESARIIGESLVYVGNDSGPLHLASMLGTPAVGLFGPAPPELTAPKSTVNTYLYRKLDCSPCDQRTCVRPGDSCMMQLGVAEVTVAVQELLRRNYPEVTVSDG